MVNKSFWPNKNIMPTHPWPYEGQAVVLSSGTFERKAFLTPDRTQHIA